MPKFGDASRQRLAGCDQRLQEICCGAIEIFDFSVVTGHRGKEDQDRAFAEDKSKLKWPNSKHNKNPSLAVDLCPYRDGLKWEDKEAFYFLAGIIISIGALRGIKIRWGGDFNRDMNLHNDKFLDIGHFEIDEEADV